MIRKVTISFDILVDKNVSKFEHFNLISELKARVDQMVRLYRGNMNVTTSDIDVRVQIKE